MMTTSNDNPEESTPRTIEKKGTSPKVRPSIQQDSPGRPPGPKPSPGRQPNQTETGPTD